MLYEQLNWPQSTTHLPEQVKDQEQQEISNFEGKVLRLVKDMRKNCREKFLTKKRIKVLKNMKKAMNYKDILTENKGGFFFLNINQAVKKKTTILQEHLKDLNLKWNNLLINQRVLEKLSLFETRTQKHPKNLIKLDWRDPNYVYDVMFQHLVPEQPFANSRQNITVELMAWSVSRNNSKGVKYSVQKLLSFMPEVPLKAMKEFLARPEHKLVPHSHMVNLSPDSEQEVLDDTVTNQYLQLSPKCDSFVPVFNSFRNNFVMVLRGF
jgi:hypothetical protein